MSVVNCSYAEACVTYTWVVICIACPVRGPSVPLTGREGRHYRCKIRAGGLLGVWVLIELEAAVIAARTDEEALWPVTME